MTTRVPAEALKVRQREISGIKIVNEVIIKEFNLTHHDCLGIQHRDITATLL